MVRVIIFLLAGAGLIYVTTSQLSQLPLSSVNPDSKIYFVDNLAEKMKLLTLLDTEEKIGRLLEYSDEKMEEIGYVLDGEADNKLELLEKVLPHHEKYIEEALEQVQKMKEEDASSTIKIIDLEKEISNKVLEKKEILNKASTLLSGEDKEALEKEIENTEKVVQQIIEQVEQPVKEIVIYKTEKIDEAIEDKKEEEQIKEEQLEKNGLTDMEKLYYVWIDNLYAKTLPKANEQFFVRAHIRRRDDTCKFFSGQMELKIINAEWQVPIGKMQPSDDLWVDLGPIDLPEGTYLLEGRLIDNSGRVISTKVFETIID